MTDLFTVEQGKRLYGFIAVGGTLGANLGAYYHQALRLARLSPANLLIIAARCSLLLRNVWFVFSRLELTGRSDDESEEPIGGSIWAGMTHIARSPYLIGLAAGSCLSTRLTNTWAYFQQSDLTREAVQDQHRTAQILRRTSKSG